MTELTSKSKIPVEPSSRDSISSWLDVLTSMLVMPDAQRAQVRDELEDHLRSRVDDLLILGKSEPESIRIAVAELGETAELARLISSANKPRHPYRRYTMNALLIAATGSLLALGIHITLPSTILPTLQTQGTGEIVADSKLSGIPFDKIKVDVRNATLGEMVEQLQTKTDIPLIVHWPMFDSFGFDRDTKIDIDSDPIPATLVLTILAERTEQYVKDSMVLHRADDQYELGSRSQFDHRTIGKRIYDLSAFVEPTPIEQSSTGRQSNRATESNNNVAKQRILDMLTFHVSSDDWRNAGGELAYASVIGNNLVISAPSRMHDEIKVLLEDLIDREVAYSKEAQYKNQRAFDRVEEEFKSVRGRLIELGERLRKIEDERDMIMASPFDQSDQQAIQVRTVHLMEISAHLAPLNFELKELEERYSFLKSRMIESQYANLFEGLD